MFILRLTSSEIPATCTIFASHSLQIFGKLNLKYAEIRYSIDVQQFMVVSKNCEKLQKPHNNVPSLNCTFFTCLSHHVFLKLVSCQKIFSFRKTLQG